MGWFDADGYLYLGDRVQDMILCGGANIYPAEVEAAINEHPAVHSCAVIGLPHEDRGNDVHAIVEADESVVSQADLLAFLAERLTKYKLPRTIEFVDEPLRDEAGKVRRADLPRATPLDVLIHSSTIHQLWETPCPTCQPPNRPPPACNCVHSSPPRVSSSCRSSTSTSRRPATIRWSCGSMRRRSTRRISVCCSVARTWPPPRRRAPPIGRS